jgi:undecaprenyl diphosphate synthase
MEQKAPKHIAIIMDGNGKWAKSKFVPKNIGHKKGAETAEKIINACKKLEVKYLTLYAFSSENWHRPKEEVKYLMDLLEDYLKNHLPKLIEQGIKVRFLGNRDALSENIKALMSNAEEISKNFDFTLLIAISYGSRDEIREAAIEFAKDLKAKDLDPSKVDKIEFDKYLYTHGIPDPDLLIRTGGELRLSNFLLWQLSYSELYFTDKTWPDFSEQDLIEAINVYKTRTRRYGR